MPQVRTPGLVISSAKAVDAMLQGATRATTKTAGRTPRAAILLSLVWNGFRAYRALGMPNGGADFRSGQARSRRLVRLAASCECSNPQKHKPEGSAFRFDAFEAGEGIRISSTGRNVKTPVATTSTPDFDPRGISAGVVGIGSPYRCGYGFASPPCHPSAAANLESSACRSLRPISAPCAGQSSERSDGGPTRFKKNKNRRCTFGFCS